MNCSQGTYLNHFLCPPVFLLVIFSLLTAQQYHAAVNGSQLRNLKSALLKRWEKLFFSSAALFRKKWQFFVPLSTPFLSIHSQMFDSVLEVSNYSLVLVTFDLSFQTQSHISASAIFIWFKVARSIDAVQRLFLRWFFSSPKKRKSINVSVCWSVKYL